MKSFGSALFSVAVIFLMSFSAFAQETQERVIDEVVAQVNDGVITLSRVNREVKETVDSLVADGKTPEEANKLIEGKKGELIANLINEELLIQKSKDLGMDSDIEASVNQRFLEIMKQNNLKTVDELYKQMEASSVNPQEIREVWRKQAARDSVLQKEVQSKIYWGFSSKEMKDYYEKNKAKFTKPETVSISEIFLSYAGRDENTVREKANELIKQIRGGADFKKIVAENSDRPKAAETGGKVDTLNVAEMDPKFAKAIKDVKVGGVSNPIDLDKIGIEILRVDERSAATGDSVFDETTIRRAMTVERAPEAQKKFMADLRQNSYIKINDKYRSEVSPILFAEERKGK